MFKADTDPRTIEWARTPPAHMLEGLETLYQLWQSYACGQPTDWEPVDWWDHCTISYQTAYNVMLRAFTEEYAP